MTFVVLALALASTPPCGFASSVEAKAALTHLAGVSGPCAAELVGWGVSSDDPALRIAAADHVGALSPVRAAAALYLLGHDADNDVRAAALEAMATRCRRGEGARCVAVFRPYLAEEADEVAWLARDLLLPFDPAAALAGAPTAYKIDVISALVVRAERDALPAAVEALQLLALDVDPEVSERARMALSRILP